MPLPLTVCCFSKIQTGFTFLAPAHPRSPGKMAVKCVCVKEHFLFLYAELFGCDNSPNEGTITFSAKMGQFSHLLKNRGRGAECSHGILELPIPTTVCNLFTSRPFAVSEI